jgi:hypothetical protein
LRRKGRAIEEAIQALIGQLSRSPTDIETARKLNMHLAAYQQLLGELKGLEIGSLHAERSGHSGEEELNYVPARSEDDPLFRYLDGEMRERLTNAINALPDARAPCHDPLLLRRCQHERDRAYHRCRGIASIANSRLRRATPSSPACYAHDAERATKQASGTPL